MKFSPFRSSLTEALIKTAIFAAAFLIVNAHVRAAGVFDPTFGANGRTTVDFGGSAQSAAVIIQPDNKIIVAGSVSRGMLDFDLAVARLNPDGSLDAAFGDAGKTVTKISPRNDFVLAAALQADGKIVVVGRAQPLDNFESADFLVVRYNANGTLDAGFGNNGAATFNRGLTDTLNSVVVQPDGKIVAAGFTSDSGGRLAVLRLNANGALDSSFGAGGTLLLDVPGVVGVSERKQAVSLLSNGRVVVAGVGYAADYGNADFIALLESNGALARDFGDQGTVVETSLPGASVDTPGFDLAVTPDDKILFLADATRRYLSNGALDPTFITGARGDRLVLRPDGRFVTTKESPLQRRTAIHASDGRLIGAAKNLGGSDVAIQSDGKIVFINFSAFFTTRLLSVTSRGTRLADFDADEKTDVSVFRQNYQANNATLYALLSSGRFETVQQNISITDIIPEDYTGEGASEYAGYARLLPYHSPGYFLYRDLFGRFVDFTWGAVATDAPVGGDYDGDGRTDFAVFRAENGYWYISLSLNNQFRAVQFGQSGDRLVPADYDYDGITDIAVFRPSNGTWYVLRSSDNKFQAVQFGQNGDLPATGDFDGDGRADFTVFRPANGVWYSLQSSAGFRAAQFGQNGDQPAPGDYDGDGRHDFAVFRGGFWYILGSSRGFYAVQWGLPTDVPVAVRY